MQRIALIATGGTIAGVASTPGDDRGYRSAQLPVAALVAAVPALAAEVLDCEQLAQIDSKDMDHATWQRLAQRCAHHLARDDVAGVVVTHGTDTLEETALFLQRVLRADKPVVLTAAMRPATSRQADGPQNLLDAVTVARQPGVRGVLAVVCGKVFAGDEVRKLHPHRIDAFDAGDAAPLATIEAGALRCRREWPAPNQRPLLQLIGGDVTAWPRVEIVYSHAGADGSLVQALLAQGVDGLVVAATGNGTVHAALEAALTAAQAHGVRVLRATRCIAGGIVGDRDGFPSAGALTPAQARVALMLELLAPA